jgi:hypothetical protein
MIGIEAAMNATFLLSLSSLAISNVAFGALFL